MERPQQRLKNCTVPPPWKYTMMKNHIYFCSCIIRSCGCCMQSHPHLSLAYQFPCSLEFLVTPASPILDGALLHVPPVPCDYPSSVRDLSSFKLAARPQKHRRQNPKSWWQDPKPRVEFFLEDAAPRGGAALTATEKLHNATTMEIHNDEES